MASNNSPNPHVTASFGHIRDVRDTETGQLLTAEDLDRLIEEEDDGPPFIEITQEGKERLRRERRDG